jgi:hypothetical protein
MSREPVQTILEQIRALLPQDRVRLADEVDRLTWRDRAEALMARIRARDGQTDPLDDAEIDRLVDAVRSEKPLYERYWTRRRRSAG